MPLRIDVHAKAWWADPARLRATAASEAAGRQRRVAGVRRGFAEATASGAAGASPCAGAGQGGWSATRRRRGKEGAAGPWRPECFVSGGNTGADSVAFSVYRRLGIGVRGYMPKGWRREDGRGREVAEEHGLLESDGGHAKRDRQNAAQSDACLGFLTTLPMTGRGTMMTVRLLTHGTQDFVPADYQKPADQDFFIIAPQAEGMRPVILFWDIAEEKVAPFSVTLRQFLVAYKPRRLLLSGPVEKTWPGMEALGSKLLALTFS